MAKPNAVDQAETEITIPSASVEAAVKKAKKAWPKKKPKTTAAPDPVSAPALVDKLVDAAVPTASAMPATFKAFTTLKVPGGWAFLELEVDTATMTVTDCKVSNPNVKAIITEQFKLTVGRYWLKLEG